MYTHLYNSDLVVIIITKSSNHFTKLHTDLTIVTFTSVLPPKEGPIDFKS